MCGLIDWLLTGMLLLSTKWLWSLFVRAGCVWLCWITSLSVYWLGCDLGATARWWLSFLPSSAPGFLIKDQKGFSAPPSRRCLCGDSDSRLQQLEPQRAGICTKTMVSPTDVFSACFVLVDDLWTFLSVHIRFSLCPSRDSRWVYRYICEAVCFLSERVECHCSDLRNKICLPFF